MEDIKDNFIPYEEAKELERLKWDDFHFGFYYENNHGSEFVVGTIITGLDINRVLRAPLWQQAFVISKNDQIILDHVAKTMDVTQHIYRWYIVNHYEFGKSSPTYEEAQLECLRQLIKISK